MGTWRNRVSSLIKDILAVVDGLSLQAVLRDAVDYQTVNELVLVVAERELGLLPRSLA